MYSSPLQASFVRPICLPDIQYAAVMGLNKDLKLKGNEFTNAATWFFIAYLIAEVPNGLSDEHTTEPSLADCLFQL